MKYSKKQLETLHIITINNIYKSTFPKGDYYANNHLLKMTKQAMINEIIIFQQQRSDKA